VRLAALISLAILGLTALLVVFVNDNPERHARGSLFESDGLALLAVSTILVVVVAALGGKQSWLGYALVQLTLGVSIVGYMIGNIPRRLNRRLRPRGQRRVTSGFEIPILRSRLQDVDAVLRCPECNQPVQ
jgi:hypothetical protein